MPDNKLTIPEILAIILSKLNISFEEIPNDINIRKTIQKSIYILQSNFGFDLGYRYGLHIAGPYSRELSDDYYNIAENSFIYNEKLDRYTFIPEVQGKLDQFKSLFHDDYDLLECFATCHFLYNQTFLYVPETNREHEVREFLVKIKPHFSNKQDKIDRSFEIINGPY
jgi:hypothetical protein